MLEGGAPKSAVKLLEFIQDFKVLHASERLILNITIDVGRRHVRVMVSAHIHFQLNVLIFI